MFETAVVPVRRPGAERRVGLLTLSLVTHTVAGIAVLAASLHSLKFPSNAPNQMSVWRSVPVIELPVAEGRPDVKKPTPVAARPHEAPRDAAPAAAATPATIPNQVPQLEATTALPPAGDTGSGASGTPGAGEGPLGTEHGIKDGLEIAGPPAEPPARVYRSTEVSALPLVLTRVSPEFPRIAQVARRSGWVVVECVIDRNGHTRDAHVAGSSWEVFEQPALEAVRQWTFKPGTIRGEPVDTLFELRVTFTLQ